MFKFRWFQVSNMCSNFAGFRCHPPVKAKIIIPALFRAKPPTHVLQSVLSIGISIIPSNISLTVSLLQYTLFSGCCRTWRRRHSCHSPSISLAKVGCLLLLLSGDVETNPGPSTADMVKCVCNVNSDERDVIQCEAISC